MDRPRCARCRNPIRTPNLVAACSGVEEVHFHTDCWGEVVSERQQEYRQNIERTGLAALLAPYRTRMPQLSAESAVAVS